MSRLTVFMEYTIWGPLFLSKAGFTVLIPGSHSMLPMRILDHCRLLYVYRYRYLLILAISMCTSLIPPASTTLCSRFWPLAWYICMYVCMYVYGYIYAYSVSMFDFAYFCDLLLLVVFGEWVGKCVCMYACMYVYLCPSVSMYTSLIVCWEEESMSS